MSAPERHVAAAFTIPALAGLAIVMLIPDPVVPWMVLAAWLLGLAAAKRLGPSGSLSMGFLYLFLLGLFHLGLVIPWSAGMISDADVPDWLRSEHVPESLRAVGLGVCAFVLGTCIGTFRHRVKACAGAGPDGPVFWGGVVCAAAGATLLGMGSAHLGLVSFSYSEYWERSLTEDVRFFGFGMSLFPLGILIAGAGATHRQFKWLAMAFLVAFVPLLLVGFRGHAIVHGVSLLVLWHRRDARSARRLAIIAGAVVLILTPIVRLARSWDMTFGTAARTARPLEFLTEAGQSLRPLVETIARRETAREPAWNGASYVHGVMRVLPNVGLARDSAESDRKRPSHWITMEAEPYAYSRGGGIGFSGVAEPYLNFGLRGVALVFVALGWLLSFAERRLLATPYTAALVGSTFGFLLWTVRNDMTALPRMFTYAAIVLLVLRVVSSTRGGARLPRRTALKG